MSATAEQLLQLLGEIDEIILVTDAEGTVSFASPAVAAVLDVDSPSLIGESVFEMIHPADRDIVRDGLGAVDDPGQTTQIRSHRLDHAERDWLWIDARWANRTDSAIDGFVYAGHEVITSAETVGEILPYEEPFRDLFEMSLNGIGLHEIITDEAGEPVDYRFLKVNDAFETATGLEAEGVEGELATDVIPGIEETEFIETYGEVALEGETRHFETYSEPLDRHYDIAAFSPKRGIFVTVFNDISDHVAREHQLEHLAETLRTIREVNIRLVRATDHEALIPDIADIIAGHPEFTCTFIVLLDDGQVESVCEAGTEMPEDQIWDIHSEEYISEVLEEDLLRMEDVTAPPYNHHVGDVPSHQGVAIPIRHDTEDYGILTIHFPPGESPASEDFELLEELGGDIGFALHSRALDEERNRLEADLQESIQQITVLDRVLRHNLKNDMNVITGFAETIRDRTESELASYAERIVETGEDLVRMVEKEREITDFLSESHQVEPIDLSSIVRAEVEEISNRYPNVDIELDQPSGVTVSGTMALGRAIEELLTNAIIHSDRETPSIVVSVDVSEETVEVCIEDDGPGIPEMELHILTGREAIEPLYHGSGLGLWLVHLAVRESGGRLSFEENEPRGSVVRIRLNSL